MFSSFHFFHFHINLLSSTDFNFYFNSSVLFYLLFLFSHTNWYHIPTYGITLAKQKKKKKKTISIHEAKSKWNQQRSIYSIKRKAKNNTLEIFQHVPFLKSDNQQQRYWLLYWSVQLKFLFSYKTELFTKIIIHNKKFKFIETELWIKIHKNCFFCAFPLFTGTYT